MCTRENKNSCAHLGGADVLTDVVIKRLQPKEKRYMLSDSNGLYIEVLPSGKKYWWVRVTVDG